MAEIKEIVEGALDIPVFNVVDFVMGRSLAEDDVVLYTNENAALHLKDAVRNLDIEADDFVPTKEMKELSAAALASKIILRLHAMDPKDYEPLFEKARKDAAEALGKFGKESDEETEIWNEYRNKLLSEIWVKTTNAEGAEDTAKKTPKEVEKFRLYLPESQRKVLEDAIVKVTFASSAIDLSADPDFLAKFQYGRKTGDT